MAQEKESTLGFIVRDEKAIERNSTDSEFAGIKVMDNIPVDSYAEMAFGNVSGTVVPRTEETGRIKGTFSIYGRVHAGESISRTGVPSKAFVPTALIKNMEESELRLKMVYTGKAREKKATETGEVLVVNKAKPEIDLLKENDVSTSLFKQAVAEVPEREIPQLGSVAPATTAETSISFPKKLLQTMTPPTVTPQISKESQTFTLKGPFGQIKLACRNIYFNDPVIIVRYGLDQGFSYTPPAGPTLVLEDTYPVVFTGIEFDMEDIDAHLQLYVLAKETQKE